MTPRVIVLLGLGLLGLVLLGLGLLGLGLLGLVLLGLGLPFQLDRALGHYEVVVAIDPRGGSVITLDPATGRRLRRTRQVLAAEWEPAGRATLVVVGQRAAIPSQPHHDSVAADGQAPRVQRDADRASRHH